MNFSSLIQGVDFHNTLEFDMTRFASVIRLDGYKNYARVSRFPDSDYSELTWLQGKGYGNLLMIGVLQQMIRLNTDILVVNVVPQEVGTTLDDLTRFYKQFGLQKDATRSSRKKYIVSGKPFESQNLPSILEKVQIQIGKLSKQ